MNYDHAGPVEQQALLCEANIQVEDNQRSQRRTVVVTKQCGRCL